MKLDLTAIFVSDACHYGSHDADAKDASGVAADHVVPGAISTAVMTGNLTNAVLSAMDLLTDHHPLLPHDSTPLNRSLGRLLGFLSGCIVAAAAASLARDWAWSLPAALAAVAIAVR